MTDHLAESIELAARVHRGHLDKGGQPYILHPLYVMYETLSTLEGMQGWVEAEGPDEPDMRTAMCAAVLHDVIEDTPATKRTNQRCEVYAAAGDRAGEAVDALTRGVQESWNNYLDRVSKDWIARLVKIEDLRHNMDLSRLGCKPDAGDLQRQRKYMDAENFLVDYGRSRSTSVGVSK